MLTICFNVDKDVVKGKTGICEKVRTTALILYLTGQPVVSVTWRKDSQQLLADGRIQLLDSDRVLRIQSIRREDAGIYQCFAENDRDAAQAVALLRLDG